MLIVFVLLDCVAKFVDCYYVFSIINTAVLKNN